MTIQTMPEPRSSRDLVLEQIRQERTLQDAKWGEQNHADGTGGMPLYTHSDVNLDMRTGAELAGIFRRRCQHFFERRTGTWRDILLEEIFEALAETDPAHLRTELVQSAAVLVAWIEAIDRRGDGR